MDRLTEMISAAVNSDPLKFNTNFEKEIRRRIFEAIDDRRAEIVSDMFEGKTWETAKTASKIGAKSGAVSGAVLGATWGGYTGSLHSPTAAAILGTGGAALGAAAGAAHGAVQGAAMGATSRVADGIGHVAKKTVKAIAKPFKKK